MSAETDALRELAANRGCRLRSSRRRKPGGDYGRYGLVDAKTGREVFGFGRDGLTATAEQIEAFLRGGAAASWKSSVGTVPKKKRDKPKPKPPPEPEPPKLALRDAKPKDAEAIAALLTDLGYEAAPADIRRRLNALAKAGEPAPLVADRGGLVGILTWHVTPVLHRARPVGRITMLTVAEAERGGGIGAALVEAAEARLKDEGCGLVEVTSNVRRLRAHGFYEKLGYERTSYRFGKALSD